MTSQIELFNALKTKLGEPETQALIEYVRGEDKESRENTATKEDIARLETKIELAKSDTLKWMFGIFLTLAMLIVGLYLK